MPTEIEKLMNLTQASKELGVSRVSLYRFIRQGKLHTIDIAGQPFLSRDEVAELKADREKQEPR